MIAGGGTGGHVVPSLQIARALVARGRSAPSIELFGSRRGQEAALWPTLEFPFTLLPGRGIRRSIRLRALIDNAGAVLGLLVATAASIVSFAGAPAPGRRHRRGLCQLSGRDRRPAHPGTHGPREHRCGPWGCQRAAGAVRRRQRGGLPRHRAAPCRADRNARPPRAGRARPVAGGAPPGESPAGIAGGAPDAGRVRRLAGGSSHQRRRGGAGGALVRSARSLAVPRGRSA